MTRSLLVSALAPACIALQLAVLSMPARGQESFGGMNGVTRDSTSKQPVAQVRITVHNRNKGTERTVVSGSDGTFTIAKLEPGPYQVAAARDGFIQSTVDVDVAAPGTYRVDFLLAADYPPARDAKAAAPVGDAAVVDELAALKKRIEQLEAALQARSAPVERTEPVTVAAAAGMPAPGQAPQAAAAPTPAPAAQHVLPEALEAPDASPSPDNFTPFAYGDFTWLNGTPRNKDTVLDTKFFTPEVRFDTHYMLDTNQPVDHTMGGATESFRSGEFQVEQISFGGDFHWQGVRGRVLTMNGLFATTTPRNDASAGVGQWDARDAYKYVSEAYGGYHFNVSHGLNVDAGIFVSYIGLFSYYNFDNWTYQPSYVSSNTPWFFNGLRIQYFPSNTLKIEPWIINGWQSYARTNKHLGFGGQILWQPEESLKLVFNNYFAGEDNLAYPLGQNPIAGAKRIHTDDSIEYRYFNSPGNAGISKAAFSFTADAGCQYGGTLSCTNGPNKSAFLGWMLYNRVWFDADKMAITVGGGAMNNPGRYLTLLPPINGADAVSGSPYFTENPGQHAYMWDTTLNFQYMPKEWITWWSELGYRHSDIPYFAGPGGVTPPNGNNGSPSTFACNSGNSAGTADPTQAQAACATQGGVWYPDLRTQELKFSVGVLVKF
jgi:hypothetical protein